MSTIDLVLLGILGAFACYGLWAGLVHAFGALVGSLLGAAVAGRLFEPAAAKFLPLFGGNLNLARVVVFLVILTLVNRLAGLALAAVDRVFRVITIIPFLTTVNRLAGVLFGLLEGALVLGGGLYLTMKFPIDVGVTAALAQSRVAPILLAIANVIVPLLPDLVRELERAVPAVRR